jgi:molybdate transport system substrate-binding protein
MMPPAAAISRAATHLKVLSAGAVKYVVTDVAAKFMRDTGDDIELSFATIGGVQKRLEHGETADIIMGTASVIAQMERAGVLVPGSRAELGHTLTGICVHAAAPMPDISTPKCFKQTMLKARSVAYTNPQAGGTSGIFLAGLLERLGIAAAVASKALLCNNGDEVVEKVSAGDAEIGSTFISEMVPSKGVKVVGPLPAAIANATAYAAGIMAGSRNREAAERFIATLTAPARRATWIAMGFEPAGRD